MSSQDLEREVKFYVPDLKFVRGRLRALDAHLRRERSHEYNLRFDTAGGDLLREARVLRLRRDRAARLTYKGPGEDRGDVSHRLEIEFVVDDFNAARRFLEALGYQVSMVYEKYRTIYALSVFDKRECLVTLDEMPFGDFVEIEGPASAEIRRAAERLGLSWKDRVLESYAQLFDRVKATLKPDFRDLTFENFRGLEVLPEHLGVRPT